MVLGIPVVQAVEGLGFPGVIDIVFGKGVSKGSCLIDLGTQYEIISKSGSWFSYNGERIAQGREKAVDYLESNLEIAKEIEDKIMQAFKEQNAII